jgi:hypothetical protein
MALTPRTTSALCAHRLTSQSGTETQGKVALDVIRGKPHDEGKVHLSLSYEMNQRSEPEARGKLEF